MSHLRASRSWQCSSRCFAVMMSALHRHISDSPTLNLLYMWTLSLVCPVLSLNKITCCGLFSLCRLSDWLEFGCCTACCESRYASPVPCLPRTMCLDSSASSPSHRELNLQPLLGRSLCHSVHNNSTKTQTVQQRHTSCA